MTGGVYQIRNTLNGRRYIGRSVNFKRRWSEHKKTLRADKGLSPYLQNAWNKYGEAAFVFEPLVVCSPSEAAAIEQLFLVGDVGEYNASKNAWSPITPGQKLSEEHRRKLSAAHLGKRMPLEQRLKIAAAHKGKKHSPEHVANRAATRRGKHGVFRHSEEAKIRIGAASALRPRQPFSAEARSRMAIARNEHLRLRAIHRAIHQGMA